MTNIRIDGIPEVIRLTENYNAELVEDLRRIVRKHSAAVTRSARQAAPRGKTGNLRSSIRSRDVSRQIGNLPGLSKTVTARGRKGNHLHWVEQETRSRMSSRGARGRMPANPFMERVARAQTPAYHAEVRARIQRKVVI